MMIRYICPSAMKKLSIRFECELEEKTLVIIHTFAVPYWKAYHQIEADDLYRTKIYVYVIGHNLTSRNFYNILKLKVLLQFS